MFVLNKILALALALTSIFSNKAMATTDYCQLSASDQLKNPALQRALISLGLLNAEIGAAVPAEMQRAFARLVHRRDQPTLASLTVADCQELKRLHRNFEEYSNLTEVSLGSGTINLLTPAKVMQSGGAKITKSADSPYWDADTKDWTFGFDAFQNNLLTQTPIAIQNRNTMHWKNTTYFYRLTTTNETSSEGVGDFTHSIKDANGIVSKFAKRYYFHQRTFEHHGLTKGLYLKFTLTPPDWFSIQPFLEPAMQNSTLVAGITEAFGVTDPKSVAWLIHAEGLTNLISSHFVERNSIRQIVTPSAHNGVETCQLNNRRIAPNRRLVRIVYATTRSITEQFNETHLKGNPEKPLSTDGLFGAEPNPEHALSFGCAILSSPRQRVDQPADSLLSSMLPSGSKKTNSEMRKVQIALHEITRQPAIAARDQPYVLLSDSSAASPHKTISGSDKRALLIVHGYNSSFSWALQQAARLAVSSNYHDRIYMFSWPSAGEGYFSWAKYFSEVDKAEAAQASLQNFITSIVQDRNVTKLDIVAHSMGALQAIRSLERISFIFDRLVPDDTKTDRPLAERLRLGQIVLIAPDVDRTVFVSNVSTLASYSERVTIYVSRSDCVLRASGWIRGIPRAGVFNAKQAPVAFDTRDGSRIYVIDTTPESTPWYSFCKDGSLGHADHVTDPRVMRDINAILRDRYAKEQLDPSRRSGKIKGETVFCKVEGHGTNAPHWIMRTIGDDGLANCPKVVSGLAAAPR